MLFDCAIGNDEAAAIMGVQRSRPKRMHEGGEISATLLDAALGGEPSRRFRIYSLAECERNWREYQSSRRLTGISRARRPRTNLTNRALVLDVLKQNPIAFDDAIGTGEASRILKTGYSNVIKLCEAGTLRARKPWNDRKGDSRLLIISRYSCERNRDAVSAMEAAGRKRGRRRFDVTDSPVINKLQKSIDTLYPEGAKRLVWHMRRERNVQVVKAKKRDVLRRLGCLRCEVCGFDFQKAYGVLGFGFAECHHVEPLAFLEHERETDLSKLAIVCANCHRMLHRPPLCRTLAELRDIVLRCLVLRTEQRADDVDGG